MNKSPIKIDDKELPIKIDDEWITYEDRDLQGRMLGSLFLLWLTSSLLL